MKTRGITGVKRGKTTFTTRTKPADSYPLDKVNRKFRATKPCQLWVADITYVATWSGFAYVAFVTDVFSRTIVGWSVSSSLKTDMLPLQALNMAAWNVSDDLTGLIHHSDRGSNYVSLTYRSNRGARWDTLGWVHRRQLRLSVCFCLVPQESGSPGRHGLTHLYDWPAWCLSVDLSSVRPGT